MLSRKDVHEETYRCLRESGSTGWGGLERMSKLVSVLEHRFFSSPFAPTSGTVLEIGCGTGNVSLEFYKRGYTVEGIDFSETAIAWAQENAVSAGAEVSFKVGDVTDLTVFNDEAFDIVFDGNCLHCLIGSERHRGLSEIFRVLKNGGIFFIGSQTADSSNTVFPETFNTHQCILYKGTRPYRYIPTPETLSSEVTLAGFQILELSTRTDVPFGHTNIFAKKRS